MFARQLQGKLCLTVGSLLAFSRALQLINERRYSLRVSLVTFLSVQESNIIKMKLFLNKINILHNENFDFSKYFIISLLAHTIGRFYEKSLKFFIYIVD